MDEPMQNFKASYLYTFNVVNVRNNEMSTSSLFNNLSSLVACILPNGEIITDPEICPIYPIYAIEAWKSSEFFGSMDETDILLVFANEDSLWMREYQDFIDYPEIIDYYTESSLIQINNENFCFIYRFY
jgi:hypothetical protein